MPLGVLVATGSPCLASTYIGEMADLTELLYTSIRYWSMALAGMGLLVAVSTTWKMTSTLAQVAHQRPPGAGARNGATDAGVGKGTRLVTVRTKPTFRPGPGESNPP